MNTRRTAKASVLLAPALLAGALLSSGCSLLTPTVPKAQLEQKIIERRGEEGNSASSVICEGPDSVKAGDRLHCAISYETGSKEDSVVVIDEIDGGWIGFDIDP